MNGVVNQISNHLFEQRRVALQGQKAPFFSCVDAVITQVQTLFHGVWQ